MCGEKRETDGRTGDRLRFAIVCVNCFEAVQTSINRPPGRRTTLYELNISVWAYRNDKTVLIIYVKVGAPVRTESGCQERPRRAAKGHEGPRRAAKGREGPRKAAPMSCLGMRVCGRCWLLIIAFAAKIERLRTRYLGA